MEGGEFYFKITDNFGEDKEDVTDINNKLPLPKALGIPIGYNSWWLLQLNRCYTPFITDIQIKAKIKGKL
ncbi:MAG: hypothetical protein ABIO44_01365 [Saprospiraceae bacterium]